MRRALSTVLACVALLAACRSTPPTEPPKTQAAAPEMTPTPNRHILSGHLIGIPIGAEVELALLEVNPKARPTRTLSTTQVRVQAQDQSFQLAFDPVAFSQGQRVELRGRVIQSGQLTMHLPTRSIAMADTQSVGTWQAVPWP